jgi:hypothetical protein
MRVFGVNKLKPVGRSFNENIWVHKDYAHLLDGRYLDMNIVKQRALELPTDFKYDIIRYQRGGSDDWISVSFIHSPNFDQAHDPIIGDSWCIKGPRRISQYGEKHTFRKQGKDPMLYHHKWMYVDVDYSKFDTRASLRWSEQWFNGLERAGVKLNYLSRWVEFLKQNKLPIENWMLNLVV